MFQQLLRTTNPPRPQPVSRSNMSSPPSPVFLDFTSRDSKHRSPAAATAQPHLLPQKSNLDIENALLSASEVCARPMSMCYGGGYVRKACARCMRPTESLPNRPGVSQFWYPRRREFITQGWRR